MTAIWDENGVRTPVTVLQIQNCQAVAIKSPTSTSPLWAIQLGATDRKEKNTPAGMLGHFRKAGVNPKRKVVEFKVTEDAVLPVGTTLSAAHFVPGQFVDAVGTSIGKGYAGVMKRWNFRGLRASHGVSISHRSAGSTGQHQDPGRVFPGKKMAGRLGGERVTVQNLPVVRIDTELNVVFVKGAVPGSDDGFVLLRDARKKMEIHGQNREKRGMKALPGGLEALPFPAATVEMAREWPTIIQASMEKKATSS